MVPSVSVPPVAIRLPLSTIAPVDCTVPLPCRKAPASTVTTPAAAWPRVPTSIEEIESTLTEAPLPPPITRSATWTVAVSEADRAVTGRPTPLMPLPRVSRPEIARVAPAPPTDTLPLTAVRAVPRSDAPTSTSRLEGAELVPSEVLAANTLPVRSTSPATVSEATWPVPPTTT